MWDTSWASASSCAADRRMRKVRGRAARSCGPKPPGGWTRCCTGCKRARRPCGPGCGCRAVVERSRAVPVHSARTSFHSKGCPPEQAAARPISPLHGRTSSAGSPSSSELSSSSSSAACAGQPPREEPVTPRRPRPSPLATPPPNHTAPHPAPNSATAPLARAAALRRASPQRSGSAHAAPALPPPPLPTFRRPPWARGPPREPRVRRAGPSPSRPDVDGSPSSPRPSGPACSPGRCCCCACCCA
jgi:hypothetical protein